MSFSYYPELLCSEESGDALSAENSPEFSSEIDSPAIILEEDESVIAGFIVEERNSFSTTPASGDSGDGVSESSLSLSSYSSNFLDSSSRSRSVAWILKVKTKNIKMTLFELPFMRTGDDRKSYWRSVVYTGGGS